MQENKIIQLDGDWCVKQMQMERKQKLIGGAVEAFKVFCGAVMVMACYGAVLAIMAVLEALTK